MSDAATALRTPTRFAPIAFPASAYLLQRFSTPLTRHAAVIAIATAVFCLQAPSYLHAPHQRLPDGGDAILNAWILAWNYHSLTHADTRIWDAPIFNPAPNTLAFSETMFGNLWLTIPVQYLTGNLVLVANALLFASFVLCAYATFLLVQHLTQSFIAGIVAGIIFSFNPYRWSEAHHLQLMPFFYAPLAWLFWHRFLECSRAVFLCSACITVIAQTYASIYLGILLAIMLSTYTAICGVADRRLFARLAKDWRLYTALTTAFVFLLPIGIPYIRAADAWNFSRSESENASFSAEPLSLFVPNDSFRAYSAATAAVSGNIRGLHGLGVTPWLLAGFGVYLTWRGRTGPMTRRFAWLAFALALFMLGPYLIWFNEKSDIPMPYLLVYHLVPGAKAMRVPARFVFPLLLCLAVLSGYAVSSLIAMLRSHRQHRRALTALASTLALFWVVDYSVADSTGFAVEQRTDFPKVYEYLASSNAGKPILELPAEVRKQFNYLHYQTAHWRPMLGGESGCYTPAIIDMAKRLQGPPTESMSRFIAATPASTVVVHLDQMDEATAAAWRIHDLSTVGFAPAGMYENAIVWERLTEPPPARARLQIQDLGVAPRNRLLSQGWHLEASVTPTDRLPWSFLNRGVAEIDIQLAGADGQRYSFRQTVALPPYLMPGESARVVIGKLRGGPKTVQRVCITGADFADYNSEMKVDQ